MEKSNEPIVDCMYCLATLGLFFFSLMDYFNFVHQCEMRFAAPLGGGVNSFTWPKLIPVNHKVKHLNDEVFTSNSHFFSSTYCEFIFLLYV